jgi:hypothetical protein
MGQLLKAMKENGEVKEGGYRRNDYSNPGIVTLKDLGITAKTSMRAQQVAKVPEDIFESVIAEALHRIGASQRGEIAARIPGLKWGRPTNAEKDRNFDLYALAEMFNVSDRLIKDARMKGDQ